MKILLVNKFLYPNGGSETYVFKLGEALSKLGHEVQYFGMEHEGRCVGNRLNIYTDNMDFHTGKLQKLLYPFKIIYSREAYKKITKVLEDFNPDVVHLNNFNFQLTPSVIYAVRDYEKKLKKSNPSAGIKIVFTAHDYQWVCPNHMMMKPKDKQLCFECEGGKYGQCTKNKCIHNSLVKSLLGTIEAKFYLWKRTYSLVDLVICPSEFLKNKLSTYPGIKDKLITMHNFVDVQSKVIEKGDYSLYFGRFSEEKGVRTLLKVCNELPEYRFVFAGNGPLNDEVNKCSNVENLGFISGEPLIETIAKAKLVIFPSEWYENCPYSVVEAQIYGTPVVASNIGGVPELVEDGVTGELYTYGNAEELKDIIKRLMNDKETLDRYTENCKQVSFDNSDTYVSKYLELIDKI